RLHMETSAALYRIVQEALGNIFRHARASSVRIALNFSDACVRLSIEDDGVEESSIAGRVGHGMENLARRVEDMQGTVQVRSEPGSGTRIEVIVPAGG